MGIKSQRFGTFPFPDDYEVTRIATLNKTDLSGGNNKYYHIEAHASKDGTKFRLFSRYGRVGNGGVTEERIPEQNSASLEDAFESLKKAKTSSRKGYVEVKLASSRVGSDVANQQILSDDIKVDKVQVSTDTKKSNLVLESSVRNLVTRLYEEAGQAVRSQLSGTLKTTTENPLGTLTLSQIDSGRKVLQDIQVMLSKSPKLKDSIDSRILDKSNEFYSAIPQTMSKRPTSKAGKPAMDAWLKSMALNNEQILDDKEDLLKLLSDVQGMVGGFATTDVEKKYLEIGCKYEPVASGNPEFKKVEKFLKSTRSRHHSWSASVLNVWRMEAKGQKTKHVPTMKDVGNVQPLFHGSRSANILGICKSGLLLRPPGVYITGSMFGNGLYFADQSSKSEQYSTSRFGGNGRGGKNSFFMFIADVALGNIKQYQTAQVGLNKPPKGYHSVQGTKGYSLLHNEFIIYDIRQHLLQYLIEFKPSGCW